MSGATTQQKKIQGRKRHLLVDTHGLLLGVKVLAAEIRDRAGGQVLLAALVGSLPRLQLIWGDSGYAGEPFEHWVKQHLGVCFEIVKHPWTGLRGVWAPAGATIDWDKIMPRGFHVLPRRWVVERTLAWLNKCRAILVRYDKKASNYLALIKLACALLWYRRHVRLAVLR